MSHSIKNQLQQSVSAACHPGGSKRSERGNPGNDWKIYSCGGADPSKTYAGYLKNLAGELGNWIRENYPDCKMAYQISPSILQDSCRTKPIGVWLRPRSRRTCPVCENWKNVWGISLKTPELTGKQTRSTSRWDARKRSRETRLWTIGHTRECWTQCPKKRRHTSPLYCPGWQDCVSGKRAWYTGSVFTWTVEDTVTGTYPSDRARLTARNTADRA